MLRISLKWIAEGFYLSRIAEHKDYLCLSHCCPGEGGVNCRRCTHHLLRARIAAGWPTAKGTVLSSGVGTSYASYGAFFYAPRVSYRYEVGGVAFEGSSIQSTRAAYASEQQALAISARFPASAEVIVHYDPQDPSAAMLDLGNDAARRRIVIGLVAFCAPVVVAGLITWLNSLG